MDYFNILNVYSCTITRSHLGPITGPVLILVKYVFCCNVLSVGKCVSIVVKIKCVNSSNMSNIYDKLNFTTNYTYFITTDTYFIKQHTHITFFDNCNGTVP
jgi:hypothetical protein